MAFEDHALPDPQGDQQKDDQQRKADGLHEKVEGEMIHRVRDAVGLHGAAEQAVNNDGAHLAK